MRPCSESAKTAFSWPVSPPHRHCVAEIAQQLAVDMIALKKSQRAWRFQPELVPANQKDPQGWTPAVLFHQVFGTAGLIAIALGVYCREWAGYLCPLAVGERPPRMPMQRPCRCLMR